jgi:hypothetical protein
MNKMLAALALLLATSPVLGQVPGGGTVTGTSLTISTLNTGVVLDVHPSISADGRYVTVNVNNSYSHLDAIETFNLTNPPLSTSAPFRPAQVGKVVFVEKDKKLLAAPVPAMALKEASLKDGVRKLAETTKSNLVLGIRGLEQAGVDLAARKTFAIEQGTLKEALLTLVKVAAPETDMVISAEEGVVQMMSHVPGPGRYARDQQDLSHGGPAGQPAADCIDED